MQHLAEWFCPLPGSFKCLIQFCVGLIVKLSVLFGLGLLLEWSVYLVVHNGMVRT